MSGWIYCVQVFLLLSVSQAFLLNLCIFWCTTVNSPLATTVTGTALEIEIGITPFCHHPWSRLVYCAASHLLVSAMQQFLVYLKVRLLSRPDEGHPDNWAGYVYFW
jgi:hypothetical protein